VDLLEPLDSHSARLCKALRESEPELVLYERAGTASQQSQALSATREGSRGDRRDQRHDLYAGGQPQDFDNWAAQGCAGWGWDDVLPYFKSCEDQERGADLYHGSGGPVSVSDLPSKHVLGEAFHAASEKLGAPRNPDFNGATQLGTGYVQTTTRRGGRWTTASGYLRGRARHNIDIKLNALVTRLVIEGKRAVGAIWRDTSGRYEARARREVVLSCGAFNSPQLLHLSGIGPPRLLKARGIEVVRELNGVSENLQDHFGIGLQFRSTRRTTVNDLYNNRAKGGLQLLRYLLFGPVASCVGIC
jgi:choline dehydrogenase